jgi:hypothetical protein
MNRRKLFGMAVVCCLFVSALVWGAAGEAFAAGSGQGAGGVPGQIEALQTRIGALEYKLGIQEDIKAIERLVYAYGYYYEANLRNRIVDLFADENPSAAMGGWGVWKGKGRIRHLFVDIDGQGAPEGAKFGRLSVFNMMQAYVEVAPDRQTAKGRFKGELVFGAFPYYAGPMWVTYQHTFVKEGVYGKSRSSTFTA